MKLLAWTLCLIVIGAGPAPAEQAPAAEAAAEKPAGVPASQPSREGSLLEEGAFDEARVPLTPPTQLKLRPRRSPPLLREGTPYVDHLTGIEKDPTGQWWTVPDELVDRLYLLPCEWLEAVENERSSPQTQFRLTGEVYRYHEAYYLKLQKAVVVTPAPAPPASRPAESAPPPAPVTTASRPTTTAPSSDTRASAEDIERELVKQGPSRPILPAAPPAPDPSAAAPGRLLRPGPGRMLVNRLVRLVPAEHDASGGAEPKRFVWRMLRFEADNTLREPPMRILPSRKLEMLERLSGNGAKPGVQFYVSGGVHTYRGRRYVLLRSVYRKREMGQF